jgi:hypothetical protein
LRKRDSIPILGLDEQLLRRQDVPGIVTDIENLRPKGPKEDPYWVPVAAPNHLNENKRENLIEIEAFKTGFVGLTDDHKVQLIYPDDYVPGNDGGEGIPVGPIDLTIKGEMQLDGDGSDSFTISVIQSGTIGVLNIDKNGRPYAIYFIDDTRQNIVHTDDVFVPFTYPDIPMVKVYPEPTDESYTDTEVENDLAKGLRRGIYYYRYAWRLGNGNNVMHSKPIPIYIGTKVHDEGTGEDAKYFYHQLRIFFEGYSQFPEPENLDFWDKNIQGVSIFLSTRCDTTREGGERAVGDLEEVTFYEIGFFPFTKYEKNVSDADYDPDATTIIYDGRASEISINDVMQVDNYSHHKTTGKELFEYNQRTIIGNTGIDFANPAPSIFDQYYYTQLTADGVYGGTRGDTALESITVKMYSIDARNVNSHFLTVSHSGLKNVNIDHDNFITTITADVDTGSISLSLDYEPSGVVLSELPFSVTLYEDDFTGDLIDYSRFDVPESAVKAKIKYLIEFDIPNQRIERLSTDWTDVFVSSAHSGDITYHSYYPVGGFLFYPDNRVKSIHVYADIQGEQGDGGDDLTIVKSNTINGTMASANSMVVNMVFPGSSPPDNEFQENQYWQANRMIASETNYPYSYQPENTYYIGRTQNEIRGFGVNSLPISQGQFGQYPLFVFSQDAIWALQQDAPDNLIAFSNKSPVSLSHGLETSKGIVNIGREIAFIYGNQIYLMGNEEPMAIGKPIQSLLNGDEKLLYFNNDERKELWVVGDNDILAYSFNHGRWFQIENNIKAFATQGNRIVSIDGEGYFRNEYNLSDDPVSVKIVTAPIHYGIPDSYKRLYYLVLRAEIEDIDEFYVTFESDGQSVFANSTKYIRPKHGSDFSYTATLRATMRPNSNQYIHRLDSEYDVRYTEWERQQQTTKQ